MRLFPDQILLDEKEEKKPPRFQLFSSQLHLDKYASGKPFFLYGHIKVYSPYNNNNNVQPSREEEEQNADDECVWDGDVSTLFCRDSDRPAPMMNNYTSLVLTQSSIPLYTSSLYFNVDLYAKNRDRDDDKGVFQLGNQPEEDFNLPVQKYDTFCKDKIKLHDGFLNLIYITLTDPLDASLDITFKTHPNYDVSGMVFSVKIYAYYGDNYGNNGIIYKNGFNYSLKLVSADLVTLSDNCKINLNTTSLAVPANGSLMIWPMIYDMYEGDPYVEERFRIIPKHKVEEITDEADYGQGEGEDEHEEEGVVSDAVKETGERPIC